MMQIFIEHKFKGLFDPAAAAAATATTTINGIKYSKKNI